jgi:formate hydrogenlyase transcriptional activator
VLLTQIAAQVAIAVGNARSHDEIAQLKDKLSKEKLYLEDEIRSQHNFGEVVGNIPGKRDPVCRRPDAPRSFCALFRQGETLHRFPRRQGFGLQNG